MIDPNWEVVDLDPTTWRNLGRFIEPATYLRAGTPDEHGLYILHEGGLPLKAVDTQAGVRADLLNGTIADPLLLAHSLYETGEWDRVHIIDRRHLASAATRAQQIENRALTLDAYYRRVFEFIWRDRRGYACVPPHPGDWHGFTYTQVQNLVQALPSPSTLVLGVLNGPEVAIGLIVQVSEGLIRRVTTFEALTLDAPLTLSAESFGKLCLAVSERFAPVAAALLCDEANAEAWLEANDKVAVLRAAMMSGKAFVRWAL